MDPSLLINNEVARRLGQQPNALEAFGMGTPQGISGIRPAQAPRPGINALEALVKVIPRAGMFVRAVDAGPVSDGTLDYARKMGWVR